MERGLIEWVPGRSRTKLTAAGVRACFERPSA